MVKYKLYDCIENKFIDILEGSVMKQSKELGIDYTWLSKMKPNNLKKISCIASRYILSCDYDKCFTLVDYDTLEEYICATNESIFIHLGVKYNANDAKYVYELKSGRQKMASICGRVFIVKGKDISLKRIKPMKAKSERNEKDVLNRKFQTRLKLKLSKRIYSAFIQKKLTKKDKTINYIGCDMEYFVKYISLRFTKGMTFENYGEWHIDHIVPCYRFDLTKEDDVKSCFHFTNLQPIWKTNSVAIKYGESENYVGNIQKSNKDMPIDYYLSNKILECVNVNKDLLPICNFTEKDAMDLSMYLVRNGGVFLPPR